MQTKWQKDVILFLSSQTISLFGSSLVQYAITWYIILTTQSGGMMTISIVCGFLPTFLLSPFAGVWVDRYPRKLLIIFSDAMIALFTLILAILFHFGYGSIWLLFIMSAFRALGTAVQNPAIGAFLPQIAPMEQLTRINAINGSIQSTIMLISPILSGALLSMSTIENIFFIDVLTALAAIFVLLLFLNVPVHEKAREKQQTGYLNDLSMGIKYIFSHSYLKLFFIYCAIFFILVAPVAFLTGLQVTRTFGADVWRLTAIEIAFSSGMIIGGLIMTVRGGLNNKIHTMTLSALLIGACTFLLGVVPDFWLYLIIMGIAGLAIPFFNIPSMVLIQEKVDQNYLGRVLGILTMILTSMMPLGMLIFGPIADIIRIEWILICTGIFLFIQGIVLHNNRILIEAGKSNTVD